MHVPGLPVYNMQPFICIYRTKIRQYRLEVFRHMGSNHWHDDARKYAGHRTPNEQHRNPDKLTKRNTVVSVHVARRNAEDGTREQSHHIGNIVATGAGD